MEYIGIIIVVIGVLIVIPLLIKNRVKLKIEERQMKYIVYTLDKETNNAQIVADFDNKKEAEDYAELMNKLDMSPDAYKVYENK